MKAAPESRILSRKQWLAFLDEICSQTRKIEAPMTKDNTLAEYGRKLERLGKMFQNPKTKLKDLFHEAHELGLIISFRVEP